MPLQKYVHQVKHGYFRPGLPQYEKDKIEEIRNIILSEMITLPDEVFGGLPHEKNERQSSSKRDVIIVRSKDRENDRDEILRNLKQAGIPSQLGRGSSSVDPIDGIHDGKNFRILVKPVSGGMQETTLNSSITELFPCIAFENNYRPNNVEAFMEFLMSVDVNKMNCIHSKDKEAAKETINKAESSSKYNEKMENAIGITQYLYDTSNDKPIDSVYWGYRSSSKPKGVPGNHPGDVFIKFSGQKKGMEFLGVSLKAGGKKTKEPQLNTYVRPVWKFFKADRHLDSLRSAAYTQIYSKIKGMSPIANFDGGKTGRHRDKSKSEKALVNYDKTNSKGYEKDYDSMLEIMRTGIIDLFNKDRSKSLDYIKSEILRDAPDVPTIVIKAVGTNYAEVTDRDELGVFLPQVQFIRAYASKTSKQNWVIELKSGNEIVSMLMTIRSNKSGNAGQKKLGQYPTGLAVKYNGLAK